MIAGARVVAVVEVPADVTWSKSPVIVTFGAGACATSGAGVARVTKAKTAAMTGNRFIAASSNKLRLGSERLRLVTQQVEPRIPDTGPLDRHRMLGVTRCRAHSMQQHGWRAP